MEGRGAVVPKNLEEKVDYPNMDPSCPPKENFEASPLLDIINPRKVHFGCHFQNGKAGKIGKRIFITSMAEKPIPEINNSLFSISLLPLPSIFFVNRLRLTELSGYRSVIEA